MAVSLTVKPEKTLESALEHFVDGVKLEGDNAYFCEKCGIKVNKLLSVLKPACITGVSFFETYFYLYIKICCSLEGTVSKLSTILKKKIKF